jgi:hypothetical protein
VYQYPIAVAQNTGIERQTLVWKHISSYLTWEVVEGGESAETGTDHQWIVVE